MIELFDFGEDDILKEFFESYIETQNELKSLSALGLTFQDLSNWKKNSIAYFDIKEALDDYFVSEIEDSLFGNAKQGDFRATEFILKHRSSKYNNKEDDINDVSSEELIQELLEKNELD